MHEFVCAKPIRVVSMVCRSVGSLPLVPEIRPSRTFGRGPNSIAPVIAVSETSPGKTHNGSFDLSHFINQFLANSVDVAHLGVRPYPDPVINDPAQILGEVSIDVWRDRAHRFVEQHLDSGVRRAGLCPCKRTNNCGRKNCPCPCQACAQELTTFDHFPLNVLGVYPAAHGKRLPGLMLQYSEFVQWLSLTTDE